MLLRSFLAKGLAVYQPTLAPASMVVAAPAPAPAPVVEKIYLRDQAVQSDPPAIQGWAKTWLDECLGQ